MSKYIFIVLLLIGSAFFSSAEIAYASANKSRLRKAAESGSKKGKWALELNTNYDKTLCSVLIGNNLVNIASSSVATVIAMALVGDAGVAVATGVMTVLLLIFGEILPKQLAKTYCDSYVQLIAPILHLFALITKPFVWLFMKMIEKISKIWGGSKGKDEITYDDLMTAVEIVEEEGILDDTSVELLQSAIEFDEREVQEVLTHRVDLVSLDINDPAEEIINTAINSDYSRIPVYDDSIDDVIGILSVNHLLRALMDEETPDIRSLLTEPVFVPQTKKLPEMLEQMQRDKFHMAVITDDYGGTLGIVTMEDILEEIVGEIWDETDDIEPDIVELNEGAFMMNGDMMLSEFLEHIDIEDPELDDYIITVNGWATEVLEDYPKVGDSFMYKNYSITIEETDDLIATKLKVVPVEIPEDEKEDEGEEE
ncbi:MAG: HlyC/CorC family transporter [Clostridiales bacterium]|nr:HlyC/CorC family transporter [Clostridiales bacterium]